MSAVEVEAHGGGDAAHDAITASADPLVSEAEGRAHDRLTPDAVLDAAAAVDLYVEAFVAGARFATTRAGASR